MSLPAQYAWLEKEGAPRMLVEALRLYGTVEQPGTADNPTILGWAAETGLSRVYSADSVPWCGLFMATVAKRAGKTLPTDPLWALNWANFGRSLPKGEAMLGDVLTFKRSGGGHVSLYVGEDMTAFHCLGGNQHDMVNITRIDKARLHSVSRAIFKTGQPGNVRKVRLSASGAISTNEA